MRFSEKTEHVLLSAPGGRHFSKCDLWTSSNGITWGAAVRNADPGVPQQTQCITWRWRGSLNLHFNQAYHSILMHSEVPLYRQCARGVNSSCCIKPWRKPSSKCELLYFLCISKTKTVTTVCETWHNPTTPLYNLSEVTYSSKIFMRNDVLLSG